MPKRHRQPDISFLSLPSRIGLEQSILDHGDCVEEVDSCACNELFSRTMVDDGNHSSSADALSGLDGTPPDTTESGGSTVDEDADESDAELIDVDFGVFDMREQDVSAIAHLLDQFCPDKANEVDRDELGAAMLASPFTCVVKVNNDDDEKDNSTADDGNNVEEEGKDEDVYGVASILDFVHECRLSSLLKFLRTNAWRAVSPGILPTELLTTFYEGTNQAKCVLLVGEYVRNVPLELTSHVLNDVKERFGKAFRVRGKQKCATKHGGDAVYAAFPCMFAILSKIQRTTNAPGADDRSVEAIASTKDGKQSTSVQKRKLPTPQQLEDLDINRYTFWREEDSVLYEFRDKHIGVVAYRCRPQYDMQPENDLPVSILYALTWEGLQEAISEIKRRETARANVQYY